jgi:5-methylcytosine-specific restriction enzyme A
MAKLTMLGSRVATLDTSIATPPPKMGEAFYSSPAWVALRDRVRREERGHCRTPGCAKPGVWVDHIVERKDGGAEFDRSNLQLLCASCHTTKTARVRAERVRR